MIKLLRYASNIKLSSYLLSMPIELAEMKPWHIYVLVVENRGILCYRFKRKMENGEYLFVSDNPVFESMTLSTEDIRTVFSIRGVFLPSIKNLVEF